MRGIFLLCLALTLSGETVSLPGSPFKLAVSKDGGHLYASLVGKQPGLAILKRTGGTLTLEQVVKTPGPLTGLALSPDGRTAFATSGGKWVLFIDLEKASITGQIEEQETDGKVYANVTADGKTLFISNERSHSISVIDVARKAVTSRIEVGNAPIALTFSADQRLLYTTSQSATPGWGWPAVCDPENPAGTGKHPKGAIVVIDVATREVKSKIEAGCNPVRLALSPDGATAYVTARKDNKVLVFDTKTFTRQAEIQVGTAPVPVAVVNGGKTILVGNSDRFAPGEAKPQSISVIDAATNRVTGTLDAGAFPRDIVTSPDGQTIYVANFSSNSISIFPPPAK